MIDLVQITLDGLMVGTSYALIALGFTLVFGTLRRLNLAHGPVIMAGTYLGAIAFQRLGVSGLAIVPVVIIGAVLAGLYVERVCFRPFSNEARLASMVSSFAIWMQIEELLTLLLPSHTNRFPALFPAMPLSLGPFSVRLEAFAAAGVALLALAGLHILLQRSRFGLGLRAMIDQPLAARLVGIPSERIGLAAFALASALGGLAGLLIAATDTQVTPMLGMWATAKGLIAMMLGGLGSLPGAIVGGLALGLIEAHTLALAGPLVRDLVAWSLLLLILAVWPGGLVGGGRHAAALSVERRV